jgi:diacylglycerol kinase (ATP)
MTEPKKNIHKNTSIFKKANYAIQGLSWSFLNDISVRIAYFISICISLPLFIFAPTITDKILVLLINLLWIIFETLNTTIEAVVDRIGLEYHDLSKVAKDVAASIPMIIVIFMIISTGLFISQIIESYNVWKKKYEEKYKEDYILLSEVQLVGKYITFSFTRNIDIQNV